MSEENEGTDIVESVAEMTGVSIPIYALRGAISCCTDADAMRHMSGVYVHSFDGNLRIAASDGHRLFVASFEDLKLPDWLIDGGVLISADDLKPRLALLDKLENTTALISFAKGASHVQVSDAADSVIFKLYPIADATFPDYQAGVVEKALGAFSREAGDFQPVGYSAGYLKDVGAMAKLLASDYVRVYSSSAVEPSVVVFDQAPGVVLYLMPSKVDSPLAPQTAKLLEGPIKGTIAALRAHQTRWEQKLEQLPPDAGETERSTIEEKVAEYQARIAKVITAANPPSLPSPFESYQLQLKQRMGDDYQQWANYVQSWFDDGFTVDDAVLHAEEIAAKEADEKAMQDEEHSAHADLRNERAALSNKKRKTAARDFLKDVRLDLVARGWTGDLANAGEADQAFADGYDVDEFVTVITGREKENAEVVSEKPGTIMAFMTDIDQLLAEKNLKAQDLLEDTPFAEWFEAGLTPQQALDRGLEAWLRTPAEAVQEDEPPMTQDQPAPAPVHLGDAEERPDNIGGFIDAVMVGIVSRHGEVEKAMRRKITAAATKGFVADKTVAEVIEEVCFDNFPTPAVEEAIEEPQLEAAE